MKVDKQFYKFSDSSGLLKTLNVGEALEMSSWGKECWVFMGLYVGFGGLCSQTND